jgi:16S rRNA processing protein RimM
VEAGRVGRPHGLDGFFHVTRADGRLLPEGAAVTVAGDATRVAARKGTAERPILRLEGHEGRAAAEALRGAPLLVARRELPPLGSDEYWAHELEGCAVVDGDAAIGVVRRLVALPSCEALDVARPDGGELLVPLVRDAVRSVDVEAGRIDVDLGFLGEPAG